MSTESEVAWCESCGGRMIRSEDGDTFRCMPCGAMLPTAAIYITSIGWVGLVEILATMEHVVFRCW